MIAAFKSQNGLLLKKKLMQLVRDFLNSLFSTNNNIRKSEKFSPEFLQKLGRRVEKEQSTFFFAAVVL